MTTKPELTDESTVLPGLAAVAFFAVLAVTMVLSTYRPAQGFGTDADVTASIGTALMNLSGGAGTVPSAGFLSLLFTVSMVLVAALVAAVLLARREGDSVLDRKRGGEQ